mgnify:CR=1 FL=1
MRARAGAAAAPAAGERLLPALAVLLRDVRAGKISGYTGAGAWPHGPAAYGPGTGILQILCGAFLPAESTSLYLFGSAGLGKTHLALSIVNTVLQKGCDVVYVSAQNAFDAIERERFASGEGDTMATLQSAELLILDDLGTEYISPYVNSCLYSLVNTRVCRRLPTIYTSNIVNDADLQRRYTEKVVSRLLGSCETLCFCGTDIRLMDK